MLSDQMFNNLYPGYGGSRTVVDDRFFSTFDGSPYKKILTGLKKKVTRAYHSQARTRIFTTNY